MVPKLAQIIDHGDAWICSRCLQPVTDDECPWCGPEPCAECRAVECECDALDEEVG